MYKYRLWQQTQYGNVSRQSSCFCGSQVKCGKTKAIALVENVLAPHALEFVVKELKSGGRLPFSIATDASNKRNRKMFPIVVRYFDVETGIRNRIIHFYEDSKESSEDIAKN